MEGSKVWSHFYYITIPLLLTQSLLRPMLCIFTQKWRRSKWNLSSWKMLKECWKYNIICIFTYNIIYIIIYIYMYIIVQIVHVYYSNQKKDRKVLPGWFFPIIPSFPAAVLSFCWGCNNNISMDLDSNGWTRWSIQNVHLTRVPARYPTFKVDHCQWSKYLLPVYQFALWLNDILQLLQFFQKTGQPHCFKSNWSAEIGRAIELCHQIIELCHQIPPNGWLENDFANPNDRFQNSILDLPLLPASETWPDPPQALEWPLPLWRSAQILGGVSWGPCSAVKKKFGSWNPPATKVARRDSLGADVIKWTNCSTGTAWGRAFSSRVRQKAHRTVVICIFFTSAQHRPNSPFRPHMSAKWPQLGPNLDHLAPTWVQDGFKTGDMAGFPRFF